MSPFLFDADLARTELGGLRRKATTVSDAYAASIIDDYLAARADSDRAQMALIRDHAYAVDPELLAELDGFDYPAAA